MSSAPKLVMAVAFAGLTMLAACGDPAVPKVQLASREPNVAQQAPASSVPPSVGPGQAQTHSALPPLAPTASPSAAAAVRPNAASSPSSSEAPAAALPVGERLRIPAIGVDAPMVTLGVDAKGVMQVPDDGVHVGWYNFSASPGSAGNAVISGHLDTATSTQAVFSRLKDLREGDSIDVLAGGKETDFQVFWSKSWPDDTAPLALILGNAPSPTLTLITCSGTWDPASKNYSNRLVVRAKLPGSI